MNTENRKTSEPTKFGLNQPQRLDLRRSNKHVTVQNLSVYYTQKNVRYQYKNNKPKIIAPARNDDFELSYGSYSVSGIQDYIENIIKKHEPLSINPLFHICINRIKKRLVFRM